jgi:hypothetical protein
MPSHIIAGTTGSMRNIYHGDLMFLLHGNDSTPTYILVDEESAFFRVISQRPLAEIFEIRIAGYAGRRIPIAYGSSIQLFRRGRLATPLTTPLALAVNGVEHPYPSAISSVFQATITDPGRQPLEPGDPIKDGHIFFLHRKDPIANKTLYLHIGDDVRLDVKSLAAAPDPYGLYDFQFRFAYDE